MNDFNINNSLGFYLSKTYIRFKEAFNKSIAQAGIPLNSDHWTVLVIVHQNPGISQTEISGYSLRDKPAITRILDFLEKEGFVSRENHKTDRRSYTIFLTETGKEIYEKLFLIARQLNEKVLADFSSEETLQLKNSLKKLMNNL